MGAKTKQDLVMLQGGLDIETPYLRVDPGMVRSSRNFEPGLNGGYRRIKGFERFDGQPEPHLQSYYLIRAIDVSTLSVGEVLTGETSGASGTIVYIGGVDLVGFLESSGDDNDIALAKKTGTFIVGENLQVAAITQTTLAIDAGEDSANLGEDSTYRYAAQNLYRADIDEAPGEGGILGTWTHLDFDYCWRNDVGGAASSMFVATPSGWSAVGFDESYLLFDAGSDVALTREPLVGDTITGVTSSATAVLVAIIKRTGAWGDSDAAGYFVFNTLVGTFVNDEDINIAAVKVADANGADIAVVLEPDGDYQVISNNYYATDNTYYVYFVNGVQDGGFEYHPSTETLIPILPQEVVPAGHYPFMLIAHKQHLFFAYPEGSLQASAPGLPLIWDGVLGAAEFGLGSDITGMIIEAGEVLITYTSRNTWGLYGNNVDDWTLTLTSPDTGAFLFSAQQMEVPIALDDRGVITLPRSDIYGNFQHSTISRLVQSGVASLKSLITKTSLVRTSNQYRLFTNDGRFLIVYLPEAHASMRGGAGGSSPQEIAQFMSCDYGTLVVTTISNAEDENGDEKILFGSATSGFVYRAEVGMNFDGEKIESFMELPFNHQKDPRTRKRYRRAHIQLDTQGPLLLNVAAEVHFGEFTTLQPRTRELFAIGATGGLWDIGEWDVIFWDAVTAHEVRYSLTGTGLNMSFIMHNDSEINEPFTIHSIMLDYDQRRRER